MSTKTLEKAETAEAGTAETAAPTPSDSTEAAVEPEAASTAPAESQEESDAAPAQATAPEAQATPVVRPARRQADKASAKGERPLPTSKLSPRKLQETLRQLREGGQADVIVYAGENTIMDALGSLYIRAMAWASYAY